MSTNTLFGTKSGADFSNDRAHRYSLWRIWDESKPLVMFIGLNPSTANETDNDPTIKSVCRIAKNNEYGGVYMMNCWSYISTDPKGLDFTMATPIVENNEWLKEVEAKCKDVVFAWGNFDIVKEKNRDVDLMKMFPNAMALHINKNGSPKHPLYCKSDIKFIPFKKTVGQILTSAITKHELSPDVIDKVIGMPKGITEKLMNDDYYTNSVPVVLFKNLLLSLNITFSEIEPAMIPTFRIVLSKETPDTIKKKPQGYTLWENEESVLKYTKHLKDIFN